jgi:hypothetical protein
MLEGLDAIDWAALEHAYGSAEDVPAVIRGLLSDNVTVRENAQEMLYVGPFHQGSITTCLPYVVRFLIELIESEDTPDREWIIRFLAQAAGSCNKCSEIDWEAIDPATQARLRETNAQDDPTEQELCSELIDKEDLFVRLAQHSAIEIRMPSLALLVRLKCSHEDMLDVCITMLRRETDRRMRAALGICLGILAGNLKDSRGRFLEEILYPLDEDIFVRLAAGVGLINAFGPDIPSKALDKLAHLMVSYPEQVVEVSSFHQADLAGIYRVWPHTSFWGALMLLNTQQRAFVADAIANVRDYLYRNGGTGAGSFESLAKMLRR